MSTFHQYIQEGWVLCVYARHRNGPETDIVEQNQYKEDEYRKIYDTGNKKNKKTQTRDRRVIVARIVKSEGGWGEDRQHGEGDGDGRGDNAVPHGCCHRSESLRQVRIVAGW